MGHADVVVLQWVRWVGGLTCAFGWKTGLCLFSSMILIGLGWHVRGSMLRVDCFQFFKLGQRIHPLTAMKDEDLVSFAWFEIYQTKQVLNEFFQTFPLRISRDPAKKLYEALNRIVPEDLVELDLGSAEEGWKKIGFRGFAVRQSATDLETILAAELNNFDTYFVSQKGSFSTPDLIEHAEIMLPEGIRRHLSPNAIEDFRQSGRCLAFNLGTAAAFHIARATEDVIRSYYAIVVGKLPTVKMRSWGTYYANLKRCPKASGKVLGWLDHIKDEYRNPVLHPEEIVIPDAALVYINACSSLIIMMVTEMVRLNESEAQLKLAIQEVPLDPAIAALGAAFDSVRSGNEENPLGLEAGATETAGSGEEG